LLKGGNSLLALLRRKLIGIVFYNTYCEGVQTREPVHERVEFNGRDSSVPPLQKEEGVYMRRILLVLAVAALTAVMMVTMAAPAMARNMGVPPGPPESSGSEGDTVVFHCATIGEKGTSVINKQSGGHGGCRS